ncbi:MULTISPECIES: zf-TFIIB domain-containing protein [Aerosakkonema]|uniref:TFIIB-type zinc ribbon-containing protein n=1 Tax=Aerosakkonema TaxID=1246629 RepID=UPI0035BAFB34
MKCPACENNLTEIVTEAITVDVCEGGCGGIWFDRFELSQTARALTRSEGLTKNLKLEIPLFSVSQVGTNLSYLSDRSQSIES